jgi:hypothetical protein
MTPASKFIKEIGPSKITDIHIRYGRNEAVLYKFKLQYSNLNPIARWKQIEKEFARVHTINLIAGIIAPQRDNTKKVYDYIYNFMKDEMKEYEEHIRQAKKRNSKASLTVVA